MTFLSRGFKNLQWYSMTENTWNLRILGVFRYKNALLGMGQNVGQPPDPHRDPHNEMRRKI